MNQLEKKITQNNSRLLTNIVKEDKVFLHSLYKEDKGISAREKLYRDIEALSPYKIDLLLSPLSNVLDSVVKADDKTAVSNAIHFYERYRRGLEVNHLKQLLEDESLGNNIRATIALSLSNIIRDSDYWIGIIQLPKNSFMLPAVLNFLKETDPRKALKLFKNTPYTNLKLLYIPLKRTMLNLAIHIKEPDIRLITDIFTDLEKSQSFEKCELIDSILKIPNLKFVREKVEEMRENPYDDISPRIHVLKGISNINSNYIVKDLDDIFAGCEPKLVLETVAVGIYTEQVFENLYVILKWLESELGPDMDGYLRQNNMRYDTVFEEIYLGNKVISVLETNKDRNIEKYRSWEEKYGQNRTSYLAERFRV